eukprot:79195_1
MLNVFLMNGFLMGSFGIVLFLRPEDVKHGFGYALKKEIHDDARMIAQILAPLISAFSLGSIIMTKLSDSNNDAKHLFGFSWFLFHAYLTVRIGRDVLHGANQLFINGGRDKIPLFVLHLTFSVWFGYYLKTQEFGWRQITPFI